MYKYKITTAFERFCSIGRKKALYVTFLILLASAFGVCWAPEFISFVVLEFIIGAANHGAFMICCVLGSSTSLSVCLSVRLSVCLSVSVSLSLSLSLSLSDPIFLSTELSMLYWLKRCRKVYSIPFLHSYIVKTATHTKRCNNSVQCLIF